MQESLCRRRGSHYTQPPDDFLFNLPDVAIDLFQRTRQTGAKPARGAARVFIPYRALVPLPVLALGRICDQVIEGLIGVAVVGKGGSEGDIVGANTQSSRRSTVRGRTTSCYLPRLKVSRMRLATPQMKLTISLWFMVPAPGFYDFRSCPNAATGACWRPGTQG